MQTPQICCTERMVDPRAKMVTAAEKWKTISTELQALTHSTTPRGAKMCKDKWNALNTDYKKVADFGKGTGNHTSYWSLSNEEKDRQALPRQFNTDFFEAIEAFQGERIINTPVHLRDSQGVADSVFSDSNQRSVPACPQRESQSNVPHTVDLDSQGPFPSNQVIHLTDTPAPTPVPTGQAAAAAGNASVPGSTLIKRKRSSAFMPVINAADKSSKVLVAALDRINATQEELERSRAQSQTKNTRQHLEYLRLRDQKAHRMTKSMVKVLSNLSTTMCHAFIKDPALIPPPITLSQSSDKVPDPSVHVLQSDEE